MNYRRMTKTSVWLCICGLILAGCQTTSLGMREHLWNEDSTRRVVLMPMDIELSLLNAGGVTEPNAAWTETAKKLALSALEEKLGETSAKLVSFKEVTTDPESVDVQLVKLHRAVGGTVLVHKYIPVLSLPTKSETFDWSLGPDVVSIGERHDADYALYCVCQGQLHKRGPRRRNFAGRRTGSRCSRRNASRIRVSRRPEKWRGRLV